MRNARKISVLLSGAAMTVIVCVCVTALLHKAGILVGKLGPALGFKASEIEQYSAIFGQLSDASINLPVLTAAAACYLTCWLLQSIRKPGNTILRTVLICILGMIAFVLILCLILWFTEVNTIRFGHVLQSLLQVLAAGTT